MIAKLLKWTVGVAIAALVGAWVVYLFGPEPSSIEKSPSSDEPSATASVPNREPVTVYIPGGYLYSQAEADASAFTDHREVVFDTDPIGTTFRLGKIENCKTLYLDVWGQRIKRTSIEVNEMESNVVKLNGYRFEFKNIVIHPHREDNERCSHAGFEILVNAD